MSLNPTKIALNQLWRHKNGHVYRILLITNEHSSAEKHDEYPITVIYTRHTDPDGKIWSRSVDAFLNSRVYVGMHVPKKWSSSTRYRFKQF